MTDMADIRTARINGLIASMSLTEKVGQLNQRLVGWKCLERRNGTFVATDYLKREIDRWGGLGILYGLFRADPWSGRSWSNGILPDERLEAAETIQNVVRERGGRGIGVALSEEAPHGHQALGATVLPTNLALGATFDPALVEQAQACVAGELAASGVHIALVSGLDIARDPRWGRCEECFGEDPLLAARMCEAIVRGMQGENRSHIGAGGVAVVLKHLAAQGEAVGGRNGQSAVLGSRDLDEIHLPPVEAGVRAGALGFMAAYNDIDGVPCCANSWLLKRYLRERLGFDGIVMADGLAVDRLENMTGSVRQAGRAALLAGVDVSLWDDGFTQLDGFGSDREVVSAVDRAVRRVLSLKVDFGLVPQRIHPSTTGVDVAVNDGKARRDRVEIADCDDFDLLRNRTQRCSQRLAEKALVLLKDYGAGPSVCGALGRPSDGPVVVAGPFADDIGCFLGDYTAPLPEGDRTSIYQELASALHGRGCEVELAVEPSDVDESVWRKASLVVVVVGGTSERGYNSAFADNGAALAVGERGATCGEGVDAADIGLPWKQDALIRRIRAITHAPVVSVVVSGRAHVLTTVLECSDAVIWAGYAGPHGPEAVVKALMGKCSMPGRMPVTLPRWPGAVPVRYNDRQSAFGVYKDAQEPVLRSFGFGLGALAGVSSGDFQFERSDDELIVSARVTSGDTPAMGALNLFVRRGGLHVVPRLAELADIVYLDMPADSSRQVHWRVPLDWLLRDTDEGVRLELWVDDRKERITTVIGH